MTSPEVATLILSALSKSEYISNIERTFMEKIQDKVAGVLHNFSAALVMSLFFLTLGSIVLGALSVALFFIVQPQLNQWQAALCVAASASLILFLVWFVRRSNV